MQLSVPRRVGIAQRCAVLPVARPTQRARALLVHAMDERSPAECQRLLAEESHSYLDVRTPAEFAGGHVEGAINVPVMLSGPGGMIPNADFLVLVQQEFPDKDADLVVGCKSGRRSAAAIAKMESEGYTSLKNVTGGYDAFQSL